MNGLFPHQTHPNHVPGHNRLKLGIKEKWFRFFALYMGHDIVDMVNSRDCDLFFPEGCLEVSLGVYLHSLVEIQSIDFP